MCLDFDVLMLVDFFDDFMKFFDEEKMVICVLWCYGVFEEFILVKDVRVFCLEIDICFEFVRVVFFYDGKLSIEGFIMDIDVKICYVLIGNEYEIVIKLDYYLNVFDNSLFVFWVLWLFMKFVIIVRNVKDFFNMDKDYLIVFEICENFCIIKVVEYSFL